MDGKFSPQQIFSVLVLLYIDVGALAGFLVAQHGTSDPMCWPRVSAFGVLETDCSNALLGWLWFFAIGLPRMIIVFPALGVAMIGASIHDSEYGTHYFLESVTWLLYSIPLLLVIWAGIWAWRKSALVTIILVFVLLAEIAHLA